MATTKVLVVDDEVEFASALAERLQLRNYDARAVYSADEGFEAISRDVPDVILLDLNMPGIKGLEALKTIKLAHPGVEVIILTGLGSEEIASEGLRNGAFDYVVKPVEIEDLVVKIDQAREKKERR